MNDVIVLLVSVPHSLMFVHVWLDWSGSSCTVDGDSLHLGAQHDVQQHNMTKVASLDNQSLCSGAGLVSGLGLLLVVRVVLRLATVLCCHECIMVADAHGTTRHTNEACINTSNVVHCMMSSLVMACQQHATQCVTVGCTDTNTKSRSRHE